MREILVHRGMSHVDAIEAARRLGCIIEPGHHGGETRLTHHLAGRCVTATHRTDASFALVDFLSRVYGAVIGAWIVSQSDGIGRVQA